MVADIVAVVVFQGVMFALIVIMAVTTARTTAQVARGVAAQA